ncbi:MAG: HlyD family secretion protein [Gemmataceae bacterium]
MATVLKPRQAHTIPHLSVPTDTSALTSVRPPMTARSAARILIVMIVLTLVSLIFVPWQQFLASTGRVTAFDPTLREQSIEAPATGRIIKIHVVEGQEVKGRKLDSDGHVIPGHEGTKLVTIRDPDPNYMNRLLAQKKTIDVKLKAAEKRKAFLENKITSLTSVRDNALKVATKSIEVAKKKKVFAQEAVTKSQIALDLAEFQYYQDKKLKNELIASELEYRRAKRDRLASQSTLSQTKALLLEADLAILRLEDDKIKVGFEYTAKIETALADKEKAIIDIETNKAALFALQTKIDRLATQDVYASVDGTVFRILTRGAGGGKIVASGTELMRIIPNIPDEERAVELYVDGNDAPLITELWQEELRRTGKKPVIKVRLQFEGYPAIQWVGWPSAAVGTFGGIIDFVDQADDGKGNFRILVRRDPEEEKTNPWPTGFALRQGLRVNGWVLLNRVSLGWELWRRLNGFPPVVAESRGYEKKKPAVLKGVKPK